MRCTTCLLAAVAATAATAQETVLGAYIFSRHGDRTSKSTPPANLTDLGYDQVFTSGTYFRNRYVASGATRRIYGMNSDLVKQSQIAASSPSDTVLQNSAMGFLQGLYPPVGENLGSNTLRNGTTVQTPLNGYQLIPISIVSVGGSNENAGWLQGSTNCANALVSSNNYYISPEYLSTKNKTQNFYNGVAPIINSTFTSSQTSFMNAYTIYDYLNVANIHNTTFPSSNLLTNETFHQLQTLADIHEFNLAYNNTDPVRAITGSVIANEIVTALNTTITGGGKQKLNIQFGAYAGMLSYFGLANLTNVNSDFYGVPDYASTLTWELVTNATVNGTFPSASEISVRFYFHNGTTSSSSEPVEYPLFNTGRSPLPWTDFVSGMNKFAITSQAQWCTACGNTTGSCSADALDNTSGGSSSSSSSTSSSKSSGGMSLAVAGVIGAMVTLAVILGAEALIMLIAGLRVVTKSTAAAAHATAVTVNTKA